MYKRQALDLALQLFHTIEEKCTDEGGYLEAFTREFNPESNDKLSENGVLAERTMNTLLHAPVSYTHLYVYKRQDWAFAVPERTATLSRNQYGLELSIKEVRD